MKLLAIRNFISLRNHFELKLGLLIAKHQIKYSLATGEHLEFSCTVLCTRAQGANISNLVYLQLVSGGGNQNKPLGVVLPSGDP